MERQKREAGQKIQNYRLFHVTGSSAQLSGQVAQGILQSESPVHKRYTDTATRRIAQDPDLDLEKIAPQKRFNFEMRRHSLGSTAEFQNKQFYTSGRGVNALAAQELTLSNNSASVNTQAVSRATGVNAKLSGSPTATKDTSAHTATLHTQTDYTQQIRKTGGGQQPSSATPENSTKSNMSQELRDEIERQRAPTSSMQLQVQQAELTNELEREKQQQEAWQAALDKLEQARIEQRDSHAKKLADLKAVATAPVEEPNQQLEWIKKKMAELHHQDTEEVAKKQEEEKKACAALESILQQQRELASRAATLVQEAGSVSLDMQHC